MKNLQVLDDELVDLSREQQKQVQGGMACWHDGRRYSVGSVILQADHREYVCTEGNGYGVWRLKPGPQPL